MGRRFLGESDDGMGRVKTDDVRLKSGGEVIFEFFENKKCCVGQFLGEN